MSLEDARDVLKLELARSGSFCSGWRSAESRHYDQIEKFPQHDWDRMPRECFIAVTCYTLDKPTIGRYLNAWCRNAQPSASSWSLFPYKGLWWFLLGAFKLLPPFPTTPVFRGAHILDVTPGNRVVFVQFISASTSRRSASHFSTTNGTLQVLNLVPTVLMRDISIYSVRDNQQEMLIWPFCTFTVFRMGCGLCSLDFAWAFPTCHLPLRHPIVPIAQANLSRPILQNIEDIVIVQALPSFRIIEVRHFSFL